METTDKYVCNALADLLVAYGVKTAIVSPGSRNAPLIVAVARRQEMRKLVVADERCAAFMALGISQYREEGVALICTSGTALLNYAPAVAEAFYRHLPLIVVSADRPYEWINQDDSQTLTQSGILDKIVKGSYDFDDNDFDDKRWVVNRRLNDALTLALSGQKGPVHINVQLREPLNHVTAGYKINSQRVIRLADTERPSKDLVERSAKIIRLTPRVLIVAGLHQPDTILKDALSHLAAYENVAVITDVASNMCSPDSICNVDLALPKVKAFEKRSLRPDLLITIGGSIVSRRLKEFLRSENIDRHWAIGQGTNTIDCYKSLTERIVMRDGVFLSMVVDALHQMSPSAPRTSYKQAWHEIVQKNAPLASDEWTAENAVGCILSQIPQSWNLQLSNGMTVRYASRWISPGQYRVDCNRGVSGIEGSTSTALGLSIADTERCTLLISGDMSASYDIAAFATRYLSPRFKMIVINNGGGDIFRRIPSTSGFPELEEYFVAPPRFPLLQLAEAYNLKYFKADSMRSLNESLQAFIADTDSPCVLEVVCLPIDHKIIIQ